MIGQTTIGVKSGRLLGTKAETLERLTPHLRCGRVLPLIWFSVGDWRERRTNVLHNLLSEFGAQTRLVVRSSARREDGAHASLAGAYITVLDVAGEHALAESIDAVVDSYGQQAIDDQVLVQPLLSDVTMSGVAFGRDPNTGAPYIVVNYDDEHADTTAVTSGRTAGLKTFLYATCSDQPVDDPRLASVVALMLELERLLGTDAVDVEFAIDCNGNLYLLQARPLVLNVVTPMTRVEHRALLVAVAAKVESGNRPHPYLHGDKTVYGVMPDWNPAEIIGIRPRPLALSLYRELVTDAIWAYQRDNYGYQNLRSFPLLIHFHGMPYIDVRVSFNSFVPKDIDGRLASNLVNYYIDRLIAAPALHDKVEFEIVFSCYTLDLPERLRSLEQYGFSMQDTKQLCDSLRRLTNRIVHYDAGLWRSDRDKLAVLEERRQAILNSNLDTLSRIYWLLEDCKRYGTLPFAGLARAGFIAVQILRSLVNVGVLSLADYNGFMNGLNTISSQMTRDLATLDRATFVVKYGHLRPGTYDILSPRYDEAPDLYFNWSAVSGEARPREERFALSLTQMRRISALLVEHGLEHDIVELFDFLAAGIESREYAKFVFTRNLSDALSLFQKLGADYGFAPEDLAFADVQCVYDLYASSLHPTEVLTASIENGKRCYDHTRHICLPSLITSPNDVWAFHLPVTEPNFITLKTVTAPVCLHTERERLAGSIVAIENADPGFDWIFSHPIAGFITAYGGVNSHMAIRANELGLPAIIGAGETQYRRWSCAEILRIDCANRRVDVLR